MAKKVEVGELVFLKSQLQAPERGEIMVVLWRVAENGNGGTGNYITIQSSTKHPALKDMTLTVQPSDVIKVTKFGKEKVIRLLSDNLQVDVFNRAIRATNHTRRGFKDDSANRIRMRYALSTNSCSDWLLHAFHWIEEKKRVERPIDWAVIYRESERF